MLKKLLSVFLESPCAFCQRSTSDTICEYCFQKLSSHQLSKSDRLKLYQDLAVFAWGKYDGQLKRMIALMKYDNKPEIGDLLGNLLGQAWLDRDFVKSNRAKFKITVIPIPLHSKKHKERGFNQAAIIAKSFCQLTGYSLNSQGLIRIRQTKAMFDLRSLAEREKNMQGAFRISDRLPQHPVLLVDDIYTTGTTVKESVRVLRKNKIKVIGVAVAAKSGIDYR